MKVPHRLHSLNKLSFSTLLDDCGKVMDGRIDTKIIDLYGTLVDARGSVSIWYSDERREHPVAVRQRGLNFAVVFPGPGLELGPSQKHD